MPSINHKGKDLKYKYEKRDSGIYSFSVGNIPVGKITKLKSGWAAVPFGQRGIGTVRGFKARLDAAEYLVKYWRYYLCVE